MFFFLYSFICIVTVYLVGGVLFKKMYRKESGRDVVPNVTFWTELPGLVKVSTVLPAKSDSDAMFCLQSYQGLIKR